MRVTITITTHQICHGKPPIKEDEFQDKTPKPKDDFICSFRMRPYAKRWSYIGAHTCMRCSLQKEKKNVEEELKRLVADEIRREPLICEKREQLQKLSHEFMDTGSEKIYKKTLPRRIEIDQRG
jgi:hypothetical protein